MQCGTSISNVTRLYVSLQLNGAKKKKQFVGIRFVRLAFLRKMLGTTKRNGIFLQLNHNVAHCNSPK